MTDMVRCEICGKLHPKGAVCCGVGAKNEIYMEEARSDEPDVTR